MNIATFMPRLVYLSVGAASDFLNKLILTLANHPPHGWGRLWRTSMRLAISPRERKLEHNKTLRDRAWRFVPCMCARFIEYDCQSCIYRRVCHDWQLEFCSRSSLIFSISCRMCRARASGVLLLSCPLRRAENRDTWNGYLRWMLGPINRKQSIIKLFPHVNNEQGNLSQSIILLFLSNRGNVMEGK